jgi:predicted ABC-type ATPase
LLAEAQRIDYRNCWCIVARNDPAINISRVRNPVWWGGHDVPEDRIAARSPGSPELPLEAIHHANRA